MSLYDWHLPQQIETAKVLALKDVVKPSYGSYLRQLFRVYSEHFSTPLHEVENLPLEYVLQNIFEYLYERKSNEDLAEEVRSVLRTDEEILAEEMQRDFEVIEDDEFFMQQLKEMEEENRRNPPKPVVEIAEKLPQEVKTIRELKTELGQEEKVEVETEGVETTVGKNQPPKATPKPRPVPAPKIETFDDLPDLPEEFSMTFDLEEDFIPAPAPKQVKPKSKK